MSQTHQVSGIPLLSEIPVLGLLFGAHNDSKSEVEGAVFIIPSVVESPDKSALVSIREAMDQYDRYGGNIERVRSFERTPPTAQRVP
jgi:pilus assembly protein CpaC